MLIMILEFSDGGTLSDRMKEKVFSEKEAKNLLHQVNFALHFLHSMNITHRDIKMENIFIDDENYTGEMIYMIGDLGFAKKTKSKMYSGVGTAYFMAPEIWEGKDYTESVDMWALGILYYNVLTNGEFPYKTSMNQPLQREILRQFKYTTRKDFSDESNEVLGRLLQYDYTKRITAAELNDHRIFDGCPKLHTNDSHKNLQINPKKPEPHKHYLVSVESIEVIDVEGDSPTMPQSEEEKKE